MKHVLSLEIYKLRKYPSHKIILLLTLLLGLFMGYIAPRADLDDLFNHLMNFGLFFAIVSANMIGQRNDTTRMTIATGVKRGALYFSRLLVAMISGLQIMIVEAVALGVASYMNGMTMTLKHGPLAIIYLILMQLCALLICVLLGYALGVLIPKGPWGILAGIGYHWYGAIAFSMISNNVLHLPVDCGKYTVQNIMEIASDYTFTVDSLLCCLITLFITILFVLIVYIIKRKKDIA